MNGKHVRLLFGLFMLFSSGLLYAQDLNSPLRTKAWPADWITAKGASARDYGVYLFRKHLQLSKKPHKFVVYVSADNRCKLFVNQHFVSAWSCAWRYFTL
jgi:alpha-L-rhamnosidase